MTDQERIAELEFKVGQYQEQVRELKSQVAYFQEELEKAKEGLTFCNSRGELCQK